MYAVFQTGGKQFRVEPGTRIRVPTLASDGSEISVGAPLVSGATVTAEVLRHGRDKKVIVFKRKRRKGFRLKKGHRQWFTEVLVNQVVL